MHKTLSRSSCLHSDKLRGKEHIWIRGQKDPPGYVFGAEKPDVWYRPEEYSLICPLNG